MNQRCFFNEFSAGLKSGRDSWAYAHSKQALLSNLEQLVATYESARHTFAQWASAQGIAKPLAADFDWVRRGQSEVLDSKRISWNRTVKKLACKQHKIVVRPERVASAPCRPFTSQYVYFHADLNDMAYRLPS